MTTSIVTATPLGVLKNSINLPGPGPYHLSEGNDSYSFNLTPGIITTIHALGGGDRIYAYGGVATVTAAERVAHDDCIARSLASSEIERRLPNNFPAFWPVRRTTEPEEDSNIAPATA